MHRLHALITHEERALVVTDQQSPVLHLRVQDGALLALFTTLTPVWSHPNNQHSSSMSQTGEWACNVIVVCVCVCVCVCCGGRGHCGMDYDAYLS